MCMCEYQIILRDFKTFQHKSNQIRWQILKKNNKQPFSVIIELERI